MPILSAPANAAGTQNGDAMDLTPPSSTPMGPPNSSPELDHQSNEPTNVGASHADGVNLNNVAAVSGLGAAAAAASQQPKVVQTAFIHKLYKMLEDPNIQHLISWSTTNESFVMSPSSEFSKVLSQYFKHTNISSFVRQLNMYGFHKVSDVFHTGSPESPLWEFKHGNGNFKRGDLVGLREIKRRASRHTLINRDTFPTPHKVSVSQPGTPVEHVPESSDVRLSNLEHNLYDVHTRLSRTEECYASLNSRHQVVLDGLARCHQWNRDLTSFIMALAPDSESSLHRDVCSMQNDIRRQQDLLRYNDDVSEALSPGRPPHLVNIALDAGPDSPRHSIQDDPRRGNLLNVPRHHPYRPPVSSNLSTSARRYGSVGHAAHSPGSMRQQVPSLPPPQHPLAPIGSPPMNLGRRHTSADIRLHGWKGSNTSPYDSGNSSAQWPSSPSRATHGGESSQQVRDVLAKYEIQPQRPPFGSGQATPPLTNDTTPSATSAESGWSMANVRTGPKAPDPPGPYSRRSSMASNVHSLLNPAETAGRVDDEHGMNENHKRKRTQ
ncbi:MAG: hypothetical protein M1825_002132 [Sarcosagium campestre]|nr:MAG: hypothetical protein M1825_002132 [Sarcosagium campestre]